MRSTTSACPTAALLSAVPETVSHQTLDGVDRPERQMLAICDNDKPVAVAGVMGGANSEIMDDTKTVVFESANFALPFVSPQARHAYRGLRPL